jgi:integrative and conjugative element protein (TIGR02256 family)
LQALTPRSARLSESALDSIQAELRSAPHGFETGGILLGTRGSQTVKIVRAGGAGPAAVRTPTFFLRDLNATQLFAARELESSGAYWVGEWHSHPLGPAHPSDADMRSYVRLILDSGLDFSTGVVSIIASPGELGSSLYAWWCAENSVEAMSLELDRP